MSDPGNHQMDDADSDDGDALDFADPSDEDSEETDSGSEAKPDAATDDDSSDESTQGLNQDEIDSLFGFDENESAGGDTAGIEAVINSALVPYERLPMLEVVFDRLVRLLSTSLRNFTSDNVEVSLESVESVRFGEYLGSLPQPTMLSVLRVDEWDNYALMTVDSQLIYSVVDVLLGGRRGNALMRLEGRPFTSIERSLVERMVHVMTGDISVAFEPLSTVTFRFDRLETNTRFAAISRPANAAIVARLRVDMDDRGGCVDLVLPYATLEPVRELLLQMFMGEKFGRDTIWENHLAEELWQTEIELSAVLDERTVRLKDIFDLRVGNRLMFGVTPDSAIELRCEGAPMFSATMGRQGDRIAVQVESRIKRDRPGKKS
jgi:flagellar motor switch protein FliM